MAITGDEGIIKKANLSDSDRVTLINRVKENSVIAKLASQMPLDIRGSDVTVIDMGMEADLVAESGAKNRATAEIETHTIKPYKFEYGARFSQEAVDSDAVGVLVEFTSAMGAKLANALDIAAIHGINPRTKQESTLIGNNCFIKQVGNIITSTTDVYSDVNSAISVIQATDNDVSGAAFSPSSFNSLANSKDKNDRPLFEELGWGLNVSEVKGLPVAASSTVSFNESGIDCLVGDFINSFRYGIAKDITLSMIPFGDPDNTGRDLAGHNEVYFRSEVFYGWFIANTDAFVIIKADN